MNDISQLHRHVGQEVGVSPWFEIGQERIDRFASAIVASQWIHISNPFVTIQRYANFWS